MNGIIEYQRTGQGLHGQGFGESSRTCGSSIHCTRDRGTIVTFSNRRQNFSDCILEKLFIDGANRANVGISLYNDQIAGGSWRNIIRRCSIWDVTTGTNSTAIYCGLSDSAPPFANDALVDAVFINRTARGLVGNGSLFRLLSCSVSGCSDTAIFTGAGSMWVAVGCVFSANNCDFNGTNIQQLSAEGWFENSKTGIYRAAIARSVSFVGCFLHTFNTDSLMDFGGAASYHFLGGNCVPTGTKSNKIINVNRAATGAILVQSLPIYYVGGYDRVQLLASTAQTGTAVAQSASATLTQDQQLFLTLGRGTFFIGVDSWAVNAVNVRSQASFTEFLFDGDGEAVVELASKNGSGGGAPFILQPSVNAITLTYQGSDSASARISGTGVVG